MRTKNQIESLRQADSAVAKEQPPGVKLLRTLCEYTGVIRDIAWSLYRRVLASSSDDGMIMLWNAETGECLHTLKGGKGYFGRVAFDPAGRMLASCGGEKTVRLWEVANGALVRTLKGHSQDVTGVSWLKDGGWLASCSMDGTVRIWDTLSWNQFTVISTGDKGGARCRLGLGFTAGCRSFIQCADTGSRHWRTNS